MPDNHSALLRGTLELLVLQTLSLGPLHGYAIAQHIERLSEDVFRVEQGSLYPALDRLQRNGLVKSAWRQTPTGRQARYYTITAAGRRMSPSWFCFSFSCHWLWRARSPSLPPPRFCCCSACLRW